MKRNNTYPLLLALAVSLSLFSCSGEELDPGDDSAWNPGPGASPAIHISISLTTEEPGTGASPAAWNPGSGALPGTRMALGTGEAPAPPDDLYLDNLWLLVYSADGTTLLDAVYTTPLKKSDGTFYAEDGFYINSGTSCLVYGVANTHNPTLFDPDGDTAAFNTVAKLQAFAVTLDAATAETDMWSNPEGGTSTKRVSLLMQGVGRTAGTAAPGRDASATPVILPRETIEMRMYRIPARIAFTCTNVIPGYTINSVQLRNVPDSVAYFRKTTDTPAYTYIDYKADEVTIAPGSTMNFLWYVPSHVHASHTTASPGTSTYIEAIATDATGGKVIFHFYPHTLSGSTYNFNLDAGTAYSYNGGVTSLTPQSLADKKHWSTAHRGSIKLNSDANAIIVRSDNLGGVFSEYYFDIAPQINKYGSYLATKSLAAASVNATHATRVIAAGSEWTAEIVWQTAPNLITLFDAKGNPLTSETPAADKVLGKGPEGNIHFSLSGIGGVQGNALIAVRDNTTNKIVWSWHLWVLNHDPGTTSYTPVNSDITQRNKRYTLLNYNLGATTNELGSGLAAYGLLYQWGRKDPFPNGEMASSDISTLYFKGDGSGYTWPATSSVADLDASVANPGVFIITNWRGSATLGTASVPTNLSWGGHDGSSTYTLATYGSYQSADKTVFDPCPAGYRVPPIAAFDKALDDAYNMQTGNFNAGFDWSTYYNLTSFTAAGPGIFPAGGTRTISSGALNFQGTNGFYWSASLYNASNGYYLDLKSGYASPRSNSIRAFGFGVRCVSL